MIREIHREDIPACAAVIRAAFLTVARAYGITRENAPRFTAFSVTEETLLRRMTEGRRMYAYEEQGGQIVGFYALTQQGPDACELNQLCVLPDFRRQSIGSAMLSDACERAGKMGCKVLRLGIVEENAPLRAWYERRGFTHTRTEQFDFFPFACGCMEKAL